MVPFQAPVLPENLTWSLAQFTSDARASEYQVSHKDFYIGTPPTLDLSTATYDGCAAFFVDSNATYPIGEPSAHPTGILPPPYDSVIGSECIAAMESDITEFVRASDIQSADDLCNGMRDAVHRGNARQACSRVALGGTDWGRIAFRGLIGPNAPRPPTPSENATANCHPVVPASYQLASVLDFNSTCCNDSLWNATYRGLPTYDFLQHQAVPIITAWSPNDATANNISVEATVSCLEAPVEAKNLDNFQGESDMDSEGKASSPLLSVFMLALPALLVLFWFC